MTAAHDQEGTSFEKWETIPPDHSSLAGHFPGEPIVPGVVLLDEVALAVAEWRARFYELRRIVSVKFLRPLLPGQQFMIRLTAANRTAAQIDFSCHVKEQIIAEGRLEVSCHE